MKKIIKTEEEWKEILTPEEYSVLREKSTEPAFAGKYYKHKEKGVYLCSACGNKLFSSEAKYDSGTGWPSFWQPVSEERVETAPDLSYNMKRVEVKCSSCGSHLGHVFDDLPRLPRGKAGGPQPTGKRFCINSVALKFRKNEKG